MFIVLFIGGFLLFLGAMGVDVIRVLVNFLMRCLLCLVIIYVANSVLQYYGQNFSVNINEITIGLSGILGVWGVLLLYALQYYFTMAG